MSAFAIDRKELRRCCGSRRWVALMERAAPFADASQVHEAAHAAFDQLDPADWLEAFEHHPRIGDLGALRARFSPHAPTADLSTREQAGVQGANEATLRALAKCNAGYEERFGHVFLVCATGKNAQEMLALLERRMWNEPADELRVAAAEQRKITALRIDRLLGSEGRA